MNPPIITNTCHAGVFKALVSLSLFFCMYSGHSQGRVLINEYLSWPANGCSVSSEYVELYNFGPGPQDVGCYILTDGDYSITIPPNTVIQPGQFFVIAGQDNLPLGCANANMAVTVNLNWNTCNCTSAPIPSTGSGFMTDGGSGSEQLVLFDASLNVVDAIVRDLSETSSPIVTSTVGGLCTSHSFDLDTMNIRYEMVGESQGRANSFARRIDGGCGWLKDPQQSGGATNNTPGATPNLDASLSITNAVTCTNTGSATVSVNSGDYTQIFPMKFTLARDVDSNNLFTFADAYTGGLDSTAHTMPVNNLLPGIYRIVVENRNGCDLRSFDFNILDCYSTILNLDFKSFQVNHVNGKIRLDWEVGEPGEVQSFMIQKSANAIDFMDYATIIISNNGSSFSAVVPEDVSLSRNLYYRIEMTTRQGWKLYSPVQKLAQESLPAAARIFPNPFKDNFVVRFPGTGSGMVKVALHDVFGRIIHSEKASMHEGNNELLVSTGLVPAGVYTLRCTDSNGKTLVSRQILKQHQ